MALPPLNIGPRAPSQSDIVAAARRAFESGDEEGARILLDGAKKAGKLDALSAGLQVSPDSALAGAMNPASRMSAPAQFAAGMGKTITDLAQGAQQIAGRASVEDVESKRQADRSLMATPAGGAGAVAGGALVSAPTAMIPGANTMAGAALIGGGYGALLPVGEGESRAANTAIGAATGAGGQFLGTRIGRALMDAPAPSPVNRSAVNAIRAGYRMQPSAIPDSPTGFKLAESLAGPQKTTQLFSQRNQATTNRLVAEQLGIGNQSITRGVLKDVAQEAYEAGYEPLKKIGIIKPSQAFYSQIDDIINRFKGSPGSFPGFVDDVVTPKLSKLKVSSFSADDAVSVIRDARAAADKAFRAGDNNLGFAYKQAAEAVEDEIERFLTAYPFPKAVQMRTGAPAQGMLDRFRDARRQIAIAHTVRRAMKGDNVSAPRLASLLEKGEPLTGNLRTIAETASNFPLSMRIPNTTGYVPFSGLDVAGGGIAGGAAIGMGNPAVLLPFVGFEGAKITARHGLGSTAGQQALARALLQGTPRAIPATARVAANTQTVSGN